VTTAPEPLSADACLEALARLLAEQLNAARQGDLGRVDRLAKQVDGRLADARRAGMTLSEADRDRLLDLHGRVRLTLAQQKDDVARQWNQVRQGKRGLGAYAASSEDPQA